LEKTQRLLFCLILTIGHITSVPAVTDAELEALEKQIEQQEAQDQQHKAKLEKQRLEDARRQAENKADEIIKKEAEIKRLKELEQQRLNEEKRQKEEAKLAEIERQRQEEDMKNKYTSLIAKAEQAIRDKNKVLAINLYNEALTLVPRDAIANSGLKKAEQLPDKICLDFVGKWQRRKETSVYINAHADGTLTGKAFFNLKGSWECLGNVSKTFVFKTDVEDWTGTLKDDGCLAVNGATGEVCWWKIVE
jgi:hypothetical protein